MRGNAQQYQQQPQVTQNNGQQLMPNGMTVQQYQQMMQQSQNMQGNMGQNMQGNMGQNMQGNMGQNMQGNMGQNNMYGGGYIPPMNDFQTEFDFNNTPKKKRPKFLFILLIIFVIFGVMLAIRMFNQKKNSENDNGNELEIVTDADGNPVLDENGNPVTAPVDSTQTNLGGDPYTNLEMALNNYNAYTIDDCVGPEHGDSYLAQEWAYVNEVTLKQEFIQKVCKQVKFVSTDSSTGKVVVSVPDYAQVTDSILADKDYIQQLFKSAGFDESTDYTFDEDCFKLFCQWVLDRGYAGETPIPSKEVTVNMILVAGPSGGRIIADDGELDNALFATDDLHNAMKEFSKICVDFNGVGYETYTEKREVHNPDYDEWYEVFKQYYDADNGVFNPKTSKWEPWYVRDENNNIKYDENGKKLVNYYSVKDENGNDWIQPAETVLEDVELQREIEIPWEEERGIPYGIIGTYYIQHDYNGIYDTVFRIGDGSIERPAGFGTPIVTYMRDIDGNYHAVKVALRGYWVQQQAIDYEEAFSDKNRGFSVSSPVQLICFEFTVENLEDEAFAFNGTEICLCNRNANVSNRTGTLYGFYDKGILEPHKKVMLNDWYSSTELNQKYVAWGRDFGRTYPLVYFDCLAGTGEIPSYSAYEQFTGKPEITEAAEE